MNKKSEIDIVDAIKENPAKIFTDPSMSVAVLVDNLRNDQANFIDDLSTDKGRRAIASRARSIVTIKTSIDSAGKDMNAELRDKINAVDEIRREVRTSLDGLRDEIRKPLDDWEAQEKARIDSHQAVIEQIVKASYVEQSETSADISARIDWLNGIDLSETALQEYSEPAKGKAEFALSNLLSALELIRTQEAERAELERLREEAARRDALAQAEQAAREEAERKAEEGRRAAEESARREAEAEERAAAAAEQARREAEAKAEQEKRALIAEQERKDRERLAAEQREREEAEARARDKEHRRTVNQNALAAIMEAGQIGEDRAKKIVTAICAGEIPHVSITY